MKSFRLRTAGFFAVILFIPLTGLVAQPVEPLHFLNNPDITSLEYYLDKADSQAFQQEWLRYARFGISSALSEWEHEARLLVGEESDLSFFKAEAKQMLDTILEERLSLWLSRSFFRTVSPPSLGKLSNDIDELNQQYLYDNDEDGNHVYKTTVGYADVSAADASGNPAIISPGDKTLWGRGVRAAIDNLLVEWQGEMQTAHSQLLSSVSDPELRERLNTAYQKDYEDYRSSYNKQLYQLYYREQSRFIKLRLNDQRSLQYLAGKETAENISNNLISETQTELNAKMNVLFQGLSTQVGEVRTEGGIINAQDWQQSFRNLLEQGFMKWDKAEEQLLLERVEWEQSAGIEIAECEKTWAEAFTTLRVKRSEWMCSYRETLEQGNRLWAQENHELQMVIQESMAELDKSIENSRSSLQGRIDNLVGMLLQSVNMMRTARTSWEYWMDQYDEGGEASFNGTDVKFDIWAMRRKILETGLDSIMVFSDEAAILHAFDWLSKYYEGEASKLWIENLSAGDKAAIFASCSIYKGLAGPARGSKQTSFSTALDELFETVRSIQAGTWEGSDALNEAFYWTELFGQYQDYAVESQDQLGAAYGIVVFDNPSLRTAFNGDKLSVALIDDSYLKSEKAWEGLYLDNWQIEMLKARAYMQYWEKQKIIAQCVYDYAADNSSTKDSAEQTGTKLQASKSAYDEILGQYNSLILRLEDIGNGLKEKQQGIKALQAEIDDYQNLLTKARADYQTMITDLYTDNPQHLADQYRLLYLQLLSAYGMDPGINETGIGTAFEEYLLAAGKYGHEEKISLLSSKVAGLLSGKNDGGLVFGGFNPATAGLSQLHRRMIISSTAGFQSKAAEAAAGCFSITDGNNINNFSEYLYENLFLEVDEYRFEIMLKLFNKYHTTGDSHEKHIILWEMQRMVRDISDKCRLDYETRLSEIRLNTSGDFKSWAARYFSGIDTGGAKTSGEIYREISGLKKTVSLENLLPAINEDLAVYDEIIGLYLNYEHNEKNEDFIFYNWNDGAVESLSDLSRMQAYQMIWDYRGSRLESGLGQQPAADEVLAEIERISAALRSLDIFLLKIGDLAANTEELENAVLSGGYLDDFAVEQGLSEEQKVSYNFLRKYLSGGHSLTSETGDLHSFIYHEKLKAQESEQALIEIMEESRTSSPALSAIDYEESYSSLLKFLIDENLLESDSSAFRRPGDIWTEKAFTSKPEVALWFRTLDLKTGDLNLPSYINEGLDDYIEELKDYAAIQAAGLWHDFLPLDLTILNQEISLKAVRQAAGGRLLETLQGNDDDIGKLLALIGFDSISAELKAGALERLYDTAGFDLAYRASLEGSFDNEDESWAELFDDVSDMKVFGENDIGAFCDEAILRAKDSYGLASAILNPYSVNWDSVPDHWRERYLGSLWNSFEFKEALWSFSSANSPVEISELERLKTLDEVLSDAEAAGDTAIGEKTIADLRVQYLIDLNCQAEVLTTLSELPRSIVFRKILAYGLGSVLTDEGDYKTDEAAAFVNWFMAEKEIDFTLESTSLNSFLKEGVDERLWLILDSASAEHQLKKDIIAMELNANELESGMENLSVLSVSQKNGLRELLEEQFFIRKYHNLLHGSIAEYTEAEYGEQPFRHLKQRGIYERFRGSLSAQWDDVVFSVSIGSGNPSMTDIIENMASNRTRICYGSSIDAQIPLSMNDVFLGMVFEELSLKLWGERSGSSGPDDSLFGELALLRSERELAIRAGHALESVMAEDARNWRSYLGSSCLASADDDKNLISGEPLERTAEDYKRDLVLGDKVTEKAIAGFTSLRVFGSCRADMDNLILDAANSFLDRAAFLTALVENWSALEGFLPKASQLDSLSSFIQEDPEADFTGEGTGSFWTYLDSLKSGDIEDVFYYTPDEVLRNGFNESRNEFRRLHNRIEALKENLGEIGYRRQQLIRLNGSPDSAKSGVLAPLKSKIAELEAGIASVRSRWQELIDGDGGYRALERDYSHVYDQARTVIVNLDDAVSEYSIARAISEYACSGYLSFESDDLEEEGGRLFDIVSKVSPFQRLHYTSEKLSRAKAAYDALSSILKEDEEHYTIYEKDEVYRSYFDAYLNSFRESLVLGRMMRVLNKALAGQETVTRKALIDWSTAIKESYNPISIRDENGDFSLSAGLGGLRLEKDDNDVWNIGWGGESVSEEDAVRYFEIVIDSETGQSCFEKDLNRWLSGVASAGADGSSLNLFRAWSFSQQWEKYQRLATDEKKKNFLNRYINRNGESDLDRAGAGQLLLSEWKASWDSINESTGESRWMYDFYKLLEQSGSMKIATSAGGDFSSETLSFLAEEESLVMANTYMSNKLKEGAEALVLSSVPAFAMAAYYFSLGAIVLGSGPLGWIAAVTLFAMATFMTTQATALVGNGTTQLAASKNIQTEIIDKSSNNIDRFLSDFTCGTNNILNSKESYETELYKLNLMRDDTDSILDLTDGQTLVQLKTSIKNAFREEGEDLRELLEQAGLLKDEDGAEAESLALDRLFAVYYEDMIETADDDYHSSGELLSLLGQKALEKKQAADVALSDYLTKSDGSARVQAEAEEGYQNAYNQYISEEIELDDYQRAARAAWGNPLFSVREHLLRLYEKQNEIVSGIDGNSQFGTDVSVELLKNQNMLLAGSDKNMGLVDYKQEVYKALCLSEMQLLKLDFAERRNLWENQMAAITARGQLEWIAGERKLRGSYENWKDECRREYHKQKESWNDKYVDFLMDKQLWLDAVSLQSLDRGSVKVLENFGDMTKGTIDAAGKDVLIGDFSEYRVSPDDILGNIIDFQVLGTLMATAISRNDGIGELPTAIFTSGTPEKLTSADNLQMIKNFQASKNEEYEKHLAVLEFRNMLDKVKFAEEKFIKQIDYSNEQVAGNLHKTMRSDGYVKKGSGYERQLVVGCSLADYIYDDGYVSEYKDYVPENVNFSKGFEDAEPEIENMDAAGLDALVDEIMGDIVDETTRIFGDEYDMSTYLLSRMELSGSQDGEGALTFERTKNTAPDEIKGPLEVLLSWLIPEEAGDGSESGKSAMLRFVDVNPGLFGLHLGFAPGFFDTADLSREWNAEGQLEYAGAGEIGRIMGEFIFNRMRECAGWVEVNIPHYKKRLWDDPYAPTMEDVTGIITSVLTAGTGGALGVWQSAAINLADDLAFAASDIGGGYSSWDEGLVDFGRKAAGAFLGTVGGELFSGLEADAGLLDQVLNNAAKQTYSNVTGSMINSITYQSEEGFGFDAKSFDEGVFGKGAIAGYGGGAAELWMGDLLMETMNAETDAFYGSLKDIGSSVTGKAIEYSVYAGYHLAENGFDNFGRSLTDAFDEMNLSVNILDAGSMLGLGRLIAASGADDYNDGFLSGLAEVSENLSGTGLFALNFSSDGISGQITTGGMNLGSSLYNLGKGTLANLAIQSYNKETGNGDLLRKGYTFGDQSMEDTIWRLLSGKDDLNFGGRGGEGETIKNTNGGRSIYLKDRFNKASGEALLKAAIVLQHEAHRDGITSRNNAAETYRAVSSHTKMAAALGKVYGFDYMAGDENLLGDVSIYMAALQTGNMGLFTDYAGGNYDSSGDYWLLEDNGTLVWDGLRDLTNEDEDLLQTDYTGSFSKSLMKYLGKENAIALLEERGITVEGRTDAEIAYELMTSSGAYWSDSNEKYNVIPTMGFNGSSLDSRLEFDLTPEGSVNLGKISQRSPTVAYEYGEGENKINATALSGCFLYATYGAVQTQAGLNLSAQQLNRITKTGLDMGFLKVDGDGIGTDGEWGREKVSALAFAELGMFNQLDFNKKGKDGSIIWGNTKKGNQHAREADSYGNEIFDPYSQVEYKEGEIVMDKYEYDVVDYNDQFLYSYHYYSQYEDSWRGF